MQALKEKFIRAQPTQIGSGEAAERIWELMLHLLDTVSKKPMLPLCIDGMAFSLVQDHFPAEFLAAVLANWGGYYSQRVYIAEARRLGIPVRLRISITPVRVPRRLPGWRPVLYMGLDQYGL
jgi:error-prone DNA polymerase